MSNCAQRVGRHRLENTERIRSEENGCKETWKCKELVKERGQKAAASACSVTAGRRKAGGGGNSSQILSSTKIVPATCQESVQMSQIQEPGPFPHS